MSTVWTMVYSVIHSHTEYSSGTASASYSIMQCANVGARRRVAACDDASWHVRASAGQGSQNANGTSSPATTTVPVLTRAAQPPASSPICARAVLPIHSGTPPHAEAPARRTGARTHGRLRPSIAASTCGRVNAGILVVHRTSWHLQIITSHQRER